MNTLTSPGTTTLPGLLNLPRELRDQIWTHAFGDCEVSPGLGEFLQASSPLCTAYQTLTSQHRGPIVPHTTAFRPLLTNKQIYNEAHPIFYDTLTLHVTSPRALSVIRNFNVGTPPSSNGLQEQQAKQNRQGPGLRTGPPKARLRKMTLYTHLNEESRYQWSSELTYLGITYPNLRQITLHNHMRAPTNYDRLIDAVYLLGPLINLPPHLRPAPVRAGLEPASAATRSGSKSDEAVGTEPSTTTTTTTTTTAATSSVLPGRRAGPDPNRNPAPTRQEQPLQSSSQVASSTEHSVPSSSALPSPSPGPVAQASATSAAAANPSSTESSASTSASAAPSSSSPPDLTPTYRSEDLNPNITLTFGYCSPEILFESPFIGAISTADTIDEHEAVMRDCLADDNFRSMAQSHNPNGMTVTLLNIARDHEQVWLEGLHRRRMGDDFMHDAAVVAAAAAAADATDDTGDAGGADDDDTDYEEHARSSVGSSDMSNDESDGGHGEADYDYDPDARNVDDLVWRSVQ